MLQKQFKDLGIPVTITKIDLQLPFAYTQRYDIVELIFELDKERSFLLIKEKRTGSLDSFIQQAAIISEDSGKDFLLCFTQLDGETRRILIKRKISFVDYQGNTYLPMISLISVQQPANYDLEKKFTNSEQQILISLLLDERKYFSYKDIVSKKHFAQTTVYRALNRFSKYGWLKSIEDKFYYDTSKRAIFNDALKYFTNPSRKKIYVEKIFFDRIVSSDEQPIYKAGATALAHYSFISEYEQSYAMTEKQFKIVDENLLEMHTYKYKVSETIELQLWKSIIEMGDKTIVDPLSLFLTFRDEEDPRTQQALEEMLDRFLGKE